jgi:hypothetical protein
MNKSLGWLWGQLENSSAGKPWFSRTHRIGIGWKAQRLLLSLPEAHKVSSSLWTGEHCRPLVLVDMQSKATGGTSKEAVGSHLQAGSSQPVKDGSDKPGMGQPRSIATRNKIHACTAHKRNKTKKKTVSRIRLGRDQGRSRCLVALSKRSCSREQDRETNGLIAALGTRSHSAAV